MNKCQHPAGFQHRSFLWDGRAAPTGGPVCPICGASPITTFRSYRVGESTVSENSTRISVSARDRAAVATLGDQVTARERYYNRTLVGNFIVRGCDGMRDRCWLLTAIEAA
jgi:hypothetical protein